MAQARFSPPKPPVEGTELHAMSPTQLPQAWQLTTALQRTLDLAELLSIFSRELSPLISHAALRYRHDALQLELETARSAYHCNHIPLLLGDEAMGELCISREQPFSDAELALLEQLLLTLAYPLRNALLYRAAKHAALEDALTGLGNRRAMEQAIEREISLSRRIERPLTLLAIDIDHFKRINDQHGHSRGDFVLRRVAQTIKGNLRESDLTYRYGGEEFVVILNNTDSDGAELVANRIRTAVMGTAMVCANKTMSVTVSVGASMLNEHTASSLFERADQALYEAKRAGRNCVRLAA